MVKYSWAAILLSVFILSGCGKGPRLYPVSGTVTLDNQPVPDGDILFLDADNRIGPDAGTIADGRFAFKAKEGKKKVEIRAFHLQKPFKADGSPGSGDSLAVEYIPERYNNKTALTAEVVSSGSNQYEFKLSSK